MNWKDKAAQHAKDCLPKECCGLLAIVKGKEVYFPCKNLANDQNLILLSTLMIGLMQRIVVNL